MEKRRSLGRKFVFDDQEFIEKYAENSNDEYILEVDVKYSIKLHDLYSDLLFLPERMETKKCEKLVCTLYNKKNYVIHIEVLNLALSHGLVLQKVH